MFPHFYWNGQDSRDMGLWITNLPPVIRAKERTQELTIPGRAGHLTMLEGENIYDGYVKECVVTVPFYANYTAITAWLRGSGVVVFSNEPERSYMARIAGEVKFERIGNSFRQAMIPFFVQPYKMQFPKESAIAIAGTSGSIYNPGDVESRPIVTVTYTGDLDVTIGGVTMSFTGLNSSTPIIVDCDAEIITSAGAIWEGTFGGDFWRIPVGTSAVAANNSCTLSIAPEWRWV